MSDSVRPCGLQPTRLLCPQDSLGQSTGVGCHSLLPEPAIQSEIRKANIILAHMYGIQKDGISDLMYRGARETRHKEQILDTVVEGEGGML